MIGLTSDGFTVIGLAVLSDVCGQAVGNVVKNIVDAAESYIAKVADGLEILRT